MSVRLNLATLLFISLSFPRLMGETPKSWEYLAQDPPGDKPVLFAPGIVSTSLFERDIAISPDGKELFFCVGLGPGSLTKLAVTRYIEGAWTQPEIPDFASNPAYNDIEPHFSPDGNTLFFGSNRPNPHGEDNYDIWMVKKDNGTWGEPTNLGGPVNSSDEEFFPSLTQEGKMYFTRRKKGERADHIFRTTSKTLQPPFTYEGVEKLGPEVNCGQAEFNAVISRDESFIIVSVAGRKDSVGSIDYYAVFRNPDDSWSEPVNLGKDINTPHFQEYSPAFSPDGKYFFFMSARTEEPKDLFGEKVTYNDLARAGKSPGNGQPDIYWVKSDFIKALKPSNEKPIEKRE